MNKREDIKRNKYNKYENRACFKRKRALILPFIIMTQPKHEHQFQTLQDHRSMLASSFQKNKRNPIRPKLKKNEGGAKLIIIFEVFRHEQS